MVTICLKRHQIQRHWIVRHQIKRHQFQRKQIKKFYFIGVEKKNSWKKVMDFCSNNFIFRKCLEKDEPMIIIFQKSYGMIHIPY